MDRSRRSRDVFDRRFLGDARLVSHAIRRASHALRWVSHASNINPGGSPIPSACQVVVLAWVVRGEG